MTERGDALLAKAKRTKANWSVADLEQLYLQNGCVILKKTKHRFGMHPANPTRRGTLPNHTNFAKGYVGEAVKVIEEGQRAEEQARKEKQHE